MFDFSIEKDLAPIGNKGKALKVVRWGDKPAKLDLRTWRQDGEELKPGKGICFTREEAVELQTALTEYLYDV